MSKILASAPEERIPMILSVLEKAEVNIGGLEEMEEWKAFEAMAVIIDLEEFVEQLRKDFPNAATDGGLRILATEFSAYCKKQKIRPTILKRALAKKGYIKPVTDGDKVGYTETVWIDGKAVRCVVIRTSRKYDDVMAVSRLGMRVGFGLMPESQSEEARCIFFIKESELNAEEAWRLSMKTCQEEDTELLQRMSKFFGIHTRNKIWIATTRSHYYGASVILYPGFLERAREVIGEDFYVVPSSVHEMLLVQKSIVTRADYLAGILMVVNKYFVEPHGDKLGDSLFEYSGGKLKEVEV